MVGFLIGLIIGSFAGMGVIAIVSVGKDDWNDR